MGEIVSPVRCNEEQSMPRRDSRTSSPKPASQQRACLGVLPPFVRTAGTLNHWAGGLDWTPCRDSANGSPLLRLLGEPAADLRRAAHPHVVFH